MRRLKTAKDAKLMVQLAQWGSSGGMQEATSWIWGDDFISDYAEFVEKYPAGSPEYGNASKVCSFFETLGTLYKHDLFNEELLFDWIAVGLVWNRMKGFALGVRETTGEPRMYENFEAMARAEPE